MRQSMKSIAGCICILVSILTITPGCASVGRPFDTTHVERVRRGQARNEVVSWFGEPGPGDKLSLADSPHGCVKRYRWGFADARASYVLWIDFDARDEVCNVVYSGAAS
jgi:hypothetical protein